MNDIWWKISQSYFDKYSLVYNQITSFNEFMRDLPNIITNNTIEYTRDNKNFLIVFENVYISMPEFGDAKGIIRKITPNECRIRDLTYASKLFVDIIRHTIENDKTINTERWQQIELGSIPIMLFSDYCYLKDSKDPDDLIKKMECIHEQGGYFIINGNEKVLMSQDRMAHNEIFVFKGKDPKKKSNSNNTNTTSTSAKKVSNTKNSVWSYYAEVRSYYELSDPNLTTTVVKLGIPPNEQNKEHQELFLEIPYLKEIVPIIPVFLAFGIERENIWKYIVYDGNNDILNKLKASLLQTPDINDFNTAIEYLSKYTNTSQDSNKLEYINYILKNKMFQGVSRNLIPFYLGHACYQLLATSLGLRNIDDRDHYSKKRAECSGPLLKNLYKSAWKKICREARVTLERKRTEINQAFFNKITVPIKGAMATGKWTVGKTVKSAKVGISQLLNRHNYLATMSNCRRLHTPSDKNNKLTKPRHLHSSQWPKICPSETPEGQSAGLIKNLSLLTGITLGFPDQVIIDILSCLGSIEMLLNNKLKPDELKDYTKILINGCWLAVTKEPLLVIDYLLKLRKNNQISYEMSVSYNKKEGIRILTDEGRLISPYIVITNGKLPEFPLEFTWDQLVEKNIIEYLDTAESETYYISSKPWDLNSEHQYSLIHPCFMLGVGALTAPFSNHSQSPRIVYQCLEENTPVLLSNGLTKKIKELELNDLVITIDPKTCKKSYSPIINIKKTITNKQMVKITTLSGRKIIVTNDHLMFSNHGWIPAGLIKGHSLGIMPFVNPEKNSDIWGVNQPIIARLLGRINAKLDLTHPDCINDKNLLEIDIYNFNQKFPNWIHNKSNTIKAHYISGFLSGSEIIKDAYIKDLLISTFNIKIIDNTIDISPENYIKFYSIIGISYCDISHKMSIASTLNYLIQGFPSSFEYKNDLLFERILSIDNVSNISIVDIDILSDNHSFIAGDGFCVHNSAMGKQALGVFAMNFLHRYDTTSHVLCYPQIPIINNIPLKQIGCDDLPTGQNLIVAVSSYTGQNQEDSVILNQDSLDNGTLKSFYYSTYSENCKKKGNVEHVIRKPEKINVKETRIDGYSKIDSDGIPKEGIPICKKDVVIGKITITPDSVKDSSCIVKTNGLNDNSITELDPSLEYNSDFPPNFNFNDSGNYRKLYSIGSTGTAIVDRTIKTSNENSQPTVKVRLLQTRDIQIGDKVASRSAQKGICGITYPRILMPFDPVTGLVPDLIMNPNALPSRMTISQPLETLLSTLCCIKGELGDSTPFQQNFSQQDISNELEQLGFNKYCDHSLYNGMTGEKMDCTIFIGPTYYQRLKHMVDDKIHCLTPDHQVLTSNGWKFIDKLDSTDSVACFNHITNTITYEIPQKIWSYHHTGSLYNIRSDFIDTCVTNNHKFLVNINNNWTLKEASEIYSLPVQLLKGSFGNVTNKYSSFIGTIVDRKLGDFIQAESIYTNKPVDLVFVSSNTVRISASPSSVFINVSEQNDFSSIYNGLVYCLTVSTGIFYVRRNGKGYWTGNSRDQNGPRETISHQPVSGRKIGGGFKVGEMEVHAGISHGASNFLQDRLLNNSDAYEMYICDFCFNPAIANIKNSYFECTFCKQSSKISKIRLPYAFKCVQQELTSTGIGVWYELEK